MKKYVSWIALFISFFVFPHLVSAHELATDKTFGALMHIEPDDDPQIGKQSSFLFDLTDTKHPFSEQNCFCTFAIYNGSKLLYSEQILSVSVAGNHATYASFYTFTNRGQYTIVFSGKAKDNSYTPFHLTYTVEVHRGNNHPISLFTSIIYAVVSGGVLLLIIIVPYAFKQIKRKSG